MLNLPDSVVKRGVKPFTYAGIDIFSLSLEELRDLLARELNRSYGFTFEYDTLLGNKKV